MAADPSAFLPLFPARSRRPRSRLPTKTFNSFKMLNVLMGETVL